MPTASSPSLVAVLGSVTAPGRLHRALGEAVGRAAAAELSRPTVIDLGQTRIAFADGTPAADLDDDTAATIDALAGADAVLLATPVYRGSLTGALKNLLDHVPVAALQDTAVGLVAMGYGPQHFLGADRHLRDILAFFGALVAPTAVYLTAADFTDGRPTEAAGTALDGLIATTLRLAAAVGDAPLAPPPFAAGRA
jgi:FMN reductase